MNHTKNISPWAWVPTLYFCTRHSIFYRKQHLRDDVYQNGRTERRNGLVHKPALSAMDYQTLLEPVCRHHQDQKMVDPFHADSDVCGIHPADAVHSTAGRGDYGGRNNPPSACSASR